MLMIYYRCDAEEQSSCGSGCYDIPDYGKLKYCGIASLKFVLDQIRKQNDMGHPLFNNLRSGGIFQFQLFYTNLFIFNVDWLMDYCSGRLKHKHENLTQVQQWLEEGFHSIRKIPRYLIPKYFDVVISKVKTINHNAQ